MGGRNHRQQYLIRLFLFTLLLLLHADFKIQDDGTLEGALDQNDADRVVSLIPKAKYVRINSAHTIHLDKPEDFIKNTKSFFLGK